MGEKRECSTEVMYHYRLGMCMTSLQNVCVRGYKFILIHLTNFSHSTSGEHVIVGAGEVHLQRCIDDLKQRFACIKLNVSAPIVPFRETIVIPPTVDRVNEAIVGETGSTQPKQNEADEGNEGSRNVLDKEKGLIEIRTANKLCSVHIRAMPLPEDVTRLLDKKSDLIKILVTVSSATSLAERRQLAEQVKLSTREALKGFYQELCSAFKEAGSIWDGAADRIWAFGPRRVGSNVLLNRIPGYKRPSMWQNLGLTGMLVFFIKQFISSLGIGTWTLHDCINSLYPKVNIQIFLAVSKHSSSNC